MSSFYLHLIHLIIDQTKLAFFFFFLHLQDKYGRTTIHLAASKNQNRNSLLQMLHDLKANVAYRDELYRTARDIAALCQNYENVKAIDEYVVHIAANGRFKLPGWLQISL